MTVADADGRREVALVNRIILCVLVCDPTTSRTCRTLLPPPHPKQVCFPREIIIAGIYLIPLFPVSNCSPTPKFNRHLTITTLTVDYNILTVTPNTNPNCNTNSVLKI